MSKLTLVHTDNAPAAIGPYSQAVVTDGWVFCSGQIPLDPNTGEMLTGSVTEQTELVLSNLRSVLEAAGSSFDLVVKTTVFLSDMNTFAEMNEVYAVQAAALPKFCDVEIECVARVG
jgi:2-iminobutanoate/2-iminopropanoate deaminase